MNVLGETAMSKDTGKAKNKIYEIAALLLAIALFAGGIYGVVSSRTAKRDYNNSDDIRKVTAIVKDYQDMSDDDDYSDRKYRAKLSFVVDGKTYTGTETYYRKISKGDMVTVEVYRTPKGEYKMSPEGNPIYFLVYCLAIPIGGFITVAMFSAVFSKEKDKKDKPSG